MSQTAYLDNSATTRPTEGVIEAMARCMREGFYNPSSLYAPALNAEKAMNACRETLARAVRVDPRGVIFTSGGTEGNNLALIGAVTALRGPGPVVYTADAHPSVTETCAALAERGFETAALGVDGEGQPDYAALESLMARKPALVSLMQVNNETGAMPDIRRVRDMIGRLSPDTLLHVDGVQGFLRCPFDARLADLYTVSAHKIHGPKGVGALYVRPGVRLRPRQTGGGQEGARRSGTENTPGVAGFHRAMLDMLALGGVEDLLRAKKRLLWDGIRARVPGALINGPGVEGGAPHILNVTFPGVRGEVMLHALEDRGVYVSTGSACSSKKRRLSPVLTAMGLSPDRAEGAVRFSLSPLTPDEEILYAAEAVGPIYDTLSRYKRR